jgi:hypothetical protein
MQAYRVEKTLIQKGILTLTNLPFQKGETVEVIILHQTACSPHKEMSSLRGMVLEYIDPTEPVAQEDWEMLA